MMYHSPTQKNNTCLTAGRKELIDGCRDRLRIGVLFGHYAAGGTP